MHRLIRSAIAAVAAVAITACSSGVKLDEPKAGVEDRSATPTNPPPTSDGVAQVDMTVDPLKDPNSPLAKRSIYFDFDSYIVKDEFRGVIDAHAKYLLSHKDRKVVLQGNTDERGGSEYNLALGQRRAEAVRKQLTLMGVPDAQMEAVSFGKEKPRAQGRDEASWAENRRVDLVYP